MSEKKHLENVLECIAQAVSQHETASEQIECGLRLVRGLPDYESYVDGLVKDAVRGMVYALRHRNNLSIRQGEPIEKKMRGVESKVKVGESKAVADAYACYFNYCVSGRALGEIRGEELAALAEAEYTEAATHRAKGKLFDSLNSLVKGEKTVREAISGRNLKKLFDECGLG